MTPAYDGSRTPSHQPSASWDPTVANTPAHSTAHFDDEFDSGGFGSSGGFGNSGFGGAATPAGSTHGGSRFGGATPISKYYFLNSNIFKLNSRFGCNTTRSIC